MTTILCAEDDDDHFFLIKHAFQKISPEIHLRHVADGEELLDYLMHRGKYELPASSPAPDLIFLDLNMPKKNGLEALKEIRSQPDLRQIPIVILTISQDKEDIRNSYRLGANSFITKPTDFQELVESLRICHQYWGKVVQIPR